MGRREVLCAALLWLLVAALWLAPVLGDINGEILRPAASGPNDGTFVLRDYWAIEQQGGTPFTLERDRTLSAPEGTRRARSVDIVNPLQPLFIWIVKPLLGLTAAWNLFILLGLTASALITYVLLRSLGFWWVAAALAAYVVGFSPWMIGHAAWGHAGLIQAWVLPLCTWAAVHAARSETWRSCVLAGAITASSFYVSFYLGVLACIAGSIIFGCLELLGSRRGWASAGYLVGLTAALLPVAFVVMVVGKPSTIIERTDEDFFAAGLRHFISPSAENPVLGQLASISPGQAELELFPGFTTTALAIAAVVLFWRRPLVLGLVAVALVGAGLCIGVRYSLFGHIVPTLGAIASDALSEFRILARYGLLTVFAIALLAGLAAHSLRRSRIGRYAAYLLLPLTVAQLFMWPLRTWEVQSVPEHVRWLGAQPRGIVAYYPMLKHGGPFYEMENHERSWQPQHGHPIFNSWGAEPRHFLGSRQLAIRAAAKYPEQPDTPRILATQGVRYVVIRRDVIPLLGDRFVTPALGMRKLKETDIASIYEVEAEPLDSSIDAYLARNAREIARTLGSGEINVSIGSRGFHPAEFGQDGVEKRWMIQKGTLVAQNDGWRGPFQLSFSAWSRNGQPRTLTAISNGVVVGKTRIAGRPGTRQLRLQGLPLGRSTLEIVATPGPARLAPADARLGSVSLSGITLSPVLVWRDI